MLPHTAVSVQPNRAIWAQTVPVARPGLGGYRVHVNHAKWTNGTGVSEGPFGQLLCTLKGSLWSVTVYTKRVLLASQEQSKGSFWPPRNSQKGPFGLPGTVKRVLSASRNSQKGPFCLRERVNEAFCLQEQVNEAFCLQERVKGPFCLLERVKKGPFCLLERVNEAFCL